MLVCPGFAKDKPPNVVTLYVDDLGYRDIGCYGGPVKTPVLDKLAAGGVRFTDFHSGAPTCSPSRATLLTGRNHHRTGVYSVLDERFHRMHLLESETTIAEVLKDNGYATAHFGKWHLGMPVQNRDNPTPADHGFDYWFGVVNGPGRSHKNPTNFLRNGKRVGEMKGYSCQIVVDEALTWIDQKRDGDEPFFLNLWFNEPHDPIAAPDEIVSQYGGLNEREAIYSGTIDNTDRAIGRLVAKLERLGELDNTIIIYASDNGSYLQERNGELRGKKGSLFEGGHRVPGIFYWKDGIPGGRVEKEPAGVVDLLPTLCGLIGIDKPEGVHLDGSDLAPLLTETTTFTRHQPLFWMVGANMVLRMGDHTLFASGTAKSPIDFKTANRLMEQVKEVLGDDLEKELGGMDLRSRMFNGKFANPEANRLRDQHRRLFYFQESWIPELKKSGIGRVQLYDLSMDLGQKNDIAKERPELAARLKEQAAAIYRSVMADAPDWPAPNEDAAAKTQSRSGTRQEFRPPHNGSPPSPKVSTASTTETAKLLARIDRNPLPKGYDGNNHQPYVDRIMAGLKPKQRARVGKLWKEKRRLDPDMPNPGAAFVRILTHVAEGAGDGAKAPIGSGTRQEFRPPRTDSPPSPKVSTSSATKASPKHPNVVFLLADDLGYRDIGCYGGPVKTPVLEKLAAGGVRFTDFHSGAPGCSHSRASFLTGRHHHRTGVYSVISERLHRMHLLESEMTIAEVLKENGFATAHFGKWHLGMPVHDRENPTPDDHGFDYWFGLVNGPGKSHKDPTQFLRNGKRVGMMKGYSCQIVVDEALTWLDEKRDADEPFFLNLWFNEPHAPIAAPDEIVSQYGALDDQAAIYSGTIDNTDRAIGRLVARLEKLGELDNTIIVYSSDNGSYRQDRNGELRGKKGSQFEGGHRVPGIFYWKGGIPGGRVEDEPAAAVDLLPTLCGLIGIEKPGGVHLDGSDLAPLLTNSGTFARHQPLFWISGANMIVRIGDHTLFTSGTARSPIDSKTANLIIKQIRELLGDDLEKGLDDNQLRSRLFSQNMKIANPEANRLRHQLRDLYYFNEAWIPELKKSELGRVQLYDLSKDIGQQNDIAKERPELVAQMKEQAAAIYRSVMADAPEWPTPKEQAAATPPIRSGTRQEFRPPHNGSAPSPKVLTTSATKAPPKSNVILIMADDIGYECYGAYGGTSYKTPVLDRMASQGMRFDHAYSNPVCTPSRVKIMTGLSNARNYAAFGILRRSERTIGHMMKDAGYRTAIAGKWQLLGTEHYPEQTRGKGSWPQDAGFQRHCLWQVDKGGPRFWGPVITTDGKTQSYEKDVFGPDIYCQFLLDRMDEYKDDPFFLYYPMALVHWDHDSTKEDPHQFIPTPHSADRNNTNQQENFADMVSYMDTIIGRIVKKTVELGIADRTLILVTGDNGTYRSIKSRIGDKVIVGGKGRPTDAGTHVALIAYQPGTVPADQICKSVVDFSDFAPTIAEATGAEPLSPTDGRSFFPQLLGRKGNPRENIFIYYCPKPETSKPLRFVRNERWKLYGDNRLFDVVNDVLEKKPVTGPASQGIRKQLQAALDQMPSEGQKLMKFD